MLHCTRFLTLLLIGLLVFTSPGCQTSKGGDDNTKNNNAKGQNKAQKKNAKKKKADQKKAAEKKTDEKAPEESTSSPKEKEEDDEETKIGFGFNIGNISFAGSEFQFGLSPNVAYRVSDPFAVGFMVKLDYYYFKDSFSQLKYSSFDIGPTIFARIKPLLKIDGTTPFMKGLFIQAEYEHATIARPYDEFGNINTNGDKIIGFRNWEDYIYIGVGASSGYPFSTFFSAHYNILDDIEHTREPFSYRLGFTWHY